MKRHLTILLPLLLVLCALFTAARAEVPVPVNGMKLKATKATVSLYREYQIKFSKLSPANGTLTWTSSDDTVASVTQTGLVTANAPGKATVTASSVNGKKVTCAITVKRIKVTSVTMAKKLEINPGHSTQILCTVKPSNASDPVPEWTSSDPTKVKVDPDGTIHALNYTTTPVTVTAKAVDGTGKSAKCLVTVKDVQVTSVKMGKTSLTMYYGSPKTLTATPSPATAKDTTLVWSSSKTSVATVDQNGLVTPTGSGKTQIIATAADGGGAKGVCTVTVKTIEVSGITLSNKKITMGEGDEAQLTATVKPSNASFPEVTWKSLDETRATVEQDGTVHAVSGGLVTIKATAGKKSATCKVYIYGEGTRRLLITAVGDLALGGDPRTNSASADPGGQERFYTRLSEIGGLDNVLANFKDIFMNDDITIGNLECTLSNRSKNRADRKSILIIGKPAYAKYLRSNGFDAMSMQNNHAMELGEEGYNDTKKALRGAGIVPIYDNVSTFKTVEGIKIGFLGLYNCNGTHLRNQVKAMSKKCDFLIVTIHWGQEEEFVYNAPSDNQKYMTHTAIDNGADLVLCCHTHRVNGIELYRNKYIVYDLGTFVNYVKNPKNTGSTDFDSMVFQISYYVFSDGTMEFEKINVIPCAYSTSTTVNDMIPRIYTAQKDKERVLAKVKKYSNITINGN